MKVFVKILLISIFPFISFFANNIQQAPSQITILFGFVLLFIALFSISLLFKGVRRDRVTTFLVMLTICFFSYSVLYKIIPVSLFRARHFIYILVTFFLCFAAYRLPIKKGILDFTIIALCTMTLMPLFQILQFTFSSKIENPNLSLKESFLQIPLKQKPNIYYIITDGYARSDVLDQLFKFDNSFFIEQLENEGFKVAKNSSANYPLTYLSLSASLNMNYVLKENDQLASRKPSSDIIRGNNRLTNYLKGQGYQYIHFYNGHWEGTNCGKNVDICSSGNTLGETATSILSLTPIKSLVLKALNTFFQGQKTTSRALPELIKFIKELKVPLKKEPFFFFAHTLPPHPAPYYNADCSSSATADRSLTKWDKSSYIQQVKCVNLDLVKLIKEIKKTDQTDPIIVIQSDHGPATRLQFDKSLNDWDKNDIFERYSVLNTYYLPVRCHNNFYNTISPVNSFRLILSCLQEKVPKLVDDVSFYSTYNSSPDYGLIKKLNTGDSDEK